MIPNIVSLPAATSSEHLEALAEVSNFGHTDMGYPEQGPWTYRKLTESSLDEELARMSGSKSYPFGVDIASLQPCLSHAFRSQDRFIVEEWDLPDGKWIFNAIMDGHLNHDTVNFVAQNLPQRVRDALRSIGAGTLPLEPEDVSNSLRSIVQELDDHIMLQFLSLFPQDLEDIDRLDDADILAALEGKDEVVARSLGGTTLVLSLTDARGRVWVANLGDCRAVLGQWQNGRWSGTQINSIHDLKNPKELSRILHDHPGEVDMIKDGRVIGFLEPTRALGDIWLKLPSLYASKVYVQSGTRQQWISPQQFRNYATRILTPPYVSNIPDIYYLVPDIPYFLLLGSDGLLSTDQYSRMDATALVQHWVNVAGSTIDLRTPSAINSALHLLRDVLGGDDIDMVSQNLTVEMEERWMDDTTIVIQKVLSAC